MLQNLSLPAWLAPGPWYPHQEGQAAGHLLNRPIQVLNLLLARQTYFLLLFENHDHPICLNQQITLYKYGFLGFLLRAVFKAPEIVEK